MGFNWTREAAELLTHMWVNHKTARSIGESLGISKNAVIGKARRLGLGQHIASPYYVTPSGEGRKPRSYASESREPRVIREVAPPNAPESLNVSFMELTSTQCRYAVTENAPHLFCGHPQQTDSSYCAFHHQLCCTPHMGKRA